MGMKNIDNTDESGLRGRLIKNVRTMTKEETDKEGWAAPAQALILDDSTMLYPSRDEEGNGAGVFAIRPRRQKGFMLFLQKIPETSFLLDKVIITCRPMSKEELKKEGWQTPAHVIILNDNTKIYASRDEEGNDSGALFIRDPMGKTSVMITITEIKTPGVQG